MFRIREWPGVVLTPKITTDECEKVGVAEGLAVEPFSQFRRVHSCVLENGTCVFHRFINGEWFEEALVVETDGGFRETADTREVVASCRKADAQVDAFHSEALE